MTPDNQIPSQFQPQPSGLSDDDKLWGLLAHVLANVLGFIGPILALVIRGQQSPFVRRHAIEALNFNITLFIGYIASAALAIVFIGFCTMSLLLIAQLVLSIMAGIAAYGGKEFRYPVTLRLIKE